MAAPRIQPRGEDVRTRRDALKDTLGYLASAPLPCRQAALRKLGWQMGGPDGTCKLYNAMGNDATRLKIPEEIECSVDGQQMMMRACA